jgi:hypothetical protein
MKLFPHYSGNFEVFRSLTGKQYARLDMDGTAYTWFAYAYDNESYGSLGFEGFDPVDYGCGTVGELQNKLEKAYQAFVKVEREDVPVEPPVITSALQAREATDRKLDLSASVEATAIVERVLYIINEIVSDKKSLATEVTFNTSPYLKESVELAADYLFARGFSVTNKRKANYYEGDDSRYIRVNW